MKKELIYKDSSYFSAQNHCAEFSEFVKFAEHADIKDLWIALRLIRNTLFLSVLRKNFRQRYNRNFIMNT